MNMTGVIKLAAEKSVAQAATGYSDSFRSDIANGFAAALIVSTAGSITVTMQASIDDSTFYDVVDSDGNALGAVVAAMTVGTKYIQFSPVIAPYIRFKIVEGNSALTLVTIYLINQDQA